MSKSDAQLLPRQRAICIFCGAQNAYFANWKSKPGKPSGRYYSCAKCQSRTLWGPESTSPKVAEALAELLTDPAFAAAFQLAIITKIDEIARRTPA